MSRDPIRTRDCRPWWWWVNPWLYIKRRDIAYDVALDCLYEACRDVRFPENPKCDSTKRIGILECVVNRCRDCGRNYVERTVSP